MEIIAIFLAVTLIIPAVYAVLIATWLINMVFAVVMNGPRKGIQEIKSWKVQS